MAQAEGDSCRWCLANWAGTVTFPPMLLCSVQLHFYLWQGRALSSQESQARCLKQRRAGCMDLGCSEGVKAMSQRGLTSWVPTWHLEYESSGMWEEHVVQVWCLVLDGQDQGCSGDHTSVSHYRREVWMHEKVCSRSYLSRGDKHGDGYHGLAHLVLLTLVAPGIKC